MASASGGAPPGMTAASVGELRGPSRRSPSWADGTIPAVAGMRAPAEVVMLWLADSTPAPTFLCRASGCLASLEVGAIRTLSACGTLGALGAAFGSLEGAACVAAGAARSLLRVQER
mmetsp:Transcript_44617/g.96978  ORF Transcript_44617/g.96978 Transcript_44617/m.96978 type:complete len:117 (+) Transcript_44617:113-463(+)